MSVLSIFWTLGVVCLILVAFAAGSRAALPCFIAMFVIGIIASIAYHMANISSENGVNTEEFDFRVEGYSTPGGSVKNDDPDFAERLRDLEQLRQDGLINEDEYEAKRKEILSDKW